MHGRPIPSLAAIEFRGAGDAERRIAGVAAAARVVRELAEAGYAQAWLQLPSGEALDPTATADIDRLSGRMQVVVGDPPTGLEVHSLPGDRLIPAPAIPAFLAGDPFATDSVVPLDRYGAVLILCRTGKDGDGPVSRWLNRPVSRAISGVLLRFSAVRPGHATVVTALLAVVMFGSLLGGGHAGLIAGGLLFQAASIVDGVDGEIARATFRTTRVGAALDTAIDAATNWLFILGVGINLDLSGRVTAAPLTVWSLGLLVIGLAIIGWRSFRAGGPFTFDLLKHDYRERFSGPFMPRLMEFLTVVSSRDFFALLFAVLIVTGIPMGVLYVFCTAVTIWICFVVASPLLQGKNDLTADRALTAGERIDPVT
jgi:CDP-L-myo-inositol myo-inositolphosphotransferase